MPVGLIPGSENSWQARRWVQVSANAVLSPIIAVMTFVCSIGNVPLAIELIVGECAQDNRPRITSRTIITSIRATAPIIARSAARLKGIKLVPGMPAEIFIHTGERSVLSYLVKPLNDQIMHAFRED